MYVYEAIELTRAWVEADASRLPGFRGAHLMGGVLALPKEATFPAYKDIDFNVVCEGAGETATYDVAYGGLILEYSVVDAAQYRSADVILANPELACNMAAGGILADPNGMLAPLSREVAAGYADPRWVAARCAYERQVVTQALTGAQYAGTPAEVFWPLSGAILYMSGLLAEASLLPPTHRRCLVLMRDVLREQGREDLHEDVLRMLGFGQLSRQQVEQYLDECAAAFDRAVEVTRTPVPFQFKFQRHVRPYVVDGAREMIEQGCHREAMFWIAGFMMFANTVLQADAPAAERPIFQAGLERLIADLGFRTPEDVAARRAAAREAGEAIFGIADGLIEQVAESKGA
jgi:hypothetical protein